MYQKRLSKVRRGFARKKLDALLISSVPNITYLTNFPNFSKDQREALLLITSNDQYILTDGRYTQAVKSTVPHFELCEITTTTSFEKLLKNLAKKLYIKRVGIEQDNLTVAEHKKLSSCFTVLKHFNTSNLRVVKEHEELRVIQRACRLGDDVFDFVLKKVKSGITEKQLAFELEYFIKKHGADISFPPIVAFGENAAIPHHQTGDRKLKTHDIVLLDFGIKISNYCSDMTRTIFFGRASAEQKKMYHTVLEAQQKAIEHLGTKHLGGGRMDSSEVESIKAKNIDRVARDYIESKGFPTIPHSLGHGIGLEVHEKPSLSPRSKDVLKPGMVFSIEPGIYEPGFGGVRIEDLVVLEKDGHVKRGFRPRLLTHASKELIEL